MLKWSHKKLQQIFLRDEKYDYRICLYLYCTVSCNSGWPARKLTRAVVCSAEFCSRSLLII